MIQCSFDGYEDEDQAAADWVRSEENQEVQSNQNSVSRVILLLDLDCYEAQVWINYLRPQLMNLDVPVVVVNLDQIILAVNYTAKASGVRRGAGRQGLRDAKRLCHDLEVIVVPDRYGKVDTFYPYTESNRILDAIQASLAKTDLGNSVILERSCNDEIYMDVTEYAVTMANVTGNDSRQIPLHIHALLNSRKQNPCLNYHDKPRLVMEGRTRKFSLETLGYRIQQVYTNPNHQDTYQHHMNELLLVHGAFLADQIICDIRRATGYHCSAGVASNKLLAKLACSENKPEGICIITDISLPRIFKSRDFRDIPGFHSKQGNDLAAELMKLKSSFSQNNTTSTNPSFTFVDMQQEDQETLYNALCAISAGQELEKSALLYAACRGKDDEIVKPKLHRDNMSTSLSFRGSHCCRDVNDLYHRIDELALDMCERIDYSTQQLGRQMQTMSVKVSMRGGGRYDGPQGVEIPYDRSNCVHRKTLRGIAEDVAAGIEMSYNFLEGITFQAKNVIEFH